MSDAEARDDLRRLIDSGVKLSRLTVLTVVCEHGRTLAKVYRVNGRDVLDVHLKPMRATVGDEVLMVRRSGGRALRDLTDVADDVEADAATACCSRTVTTGWLRHEIGTRARRTVLRANDGKV